MKQWQVYQQCLSLDYLVNVKLVNVYFCASAHFNNRSNFGITSAVFPFASFHSYSGKTGLMGQFDETLTRQECDEMLRRTARIKIFSQVLFFSKANRQSSFIRT